MFKIGILTFHDTLNYGASLQSYALQEKISQMGAMVEVIDYKCIKFVKEYSPIFISQMSMRKILYMLLTLRTNIIKTRKKNRFQKKYIRMSRPYNNRNIQSSNNEYDIFITGSDQVWNWHLTDFDKTYFLDFVKEDTKKYSYAASFGLASIEAEKYEEYKELLSKFSEISIRENTGRRILSELYEGRVNVSVDPVLLLTAEEWENIAITPRISDYILLYSINDTIAYEYAVKLAKKTKKKLIYINAPIKRIGPFKRVASIGPDEFMGWIKQAEYVVTDSFHGVVTSILFKKKFVAFQNRRTEANTNSRIYDLLNRLDLIDRIVCDLSQMNVICEEISYHTVENKLNECIQDSDSFLKNIIGDNHGKCTIINCDSCL